MGKFRNTGGGVEGHGISLQRAAPTPGRATAAVVWSAAFCTSVAAAIPEWRDVYPTPFEPVTGLANPLRGMHVWRGVPLADQLPPEQPPLDAYDRFPWNRLEPTLGEYSGIDTFLEPKIRAAAAAGRRFAFRIQGMLGYCDSSRMPFDPRPEIPGFVPLHRRGVTTRIDTSCSGSGFVPDWNDPDVLAAMEGLLAELGRRYAYDQRIAWIDIGWYGQYGEFYVDRRVYEQDPGPMENITLENRKRVIKAHADAFPGQQLVVFGLYGNIEGIRYAYALPMARPIGLRFDCLGLEESWFNQWTHANPNDYPLIRDRWQLAPVVGETCGSRAATPGMGQRMLTDARKVGLTSFGNGNFYGMNNDPPELPHLQNFARSIGFNFRIPKIGYTFIGAAGDQFQVQSSWLNTGIAKLYERFNVYWQLRHPKGFMVPLRSTLDLRTLLPQRPYVHTDLLQIPADTPAGEYQLELQVLDAASPLQANNRPPLKLAITGVQADGSYPVGPFFVVSSSACALPQCEVRTTSSTVWVGQTVRLDANCSPGTTDYTWTSSGDGPHPEGRSSTLQFLRAGSYCYTASGNGANGQGPASPSRCITVRGVE